MDDIYMFVFKFDFFKINPTKKKELNCLCLNSGKLAWNCQLLKIIIIVPNLIVPNEAYFFLLALISYQQK